MQQVLILPSHISAETDGFHVSPSSGPVEYRSKRANEFLMRPIPAQIDHRSSAESIPGRDVETYRGFGNPQLPKTTTTAGQAANPARHIVLSKNKTIMREISGDISSESMTFDMLQKQRQLQSQLEKQQQLLQQLQG